MVEPPPRDPREPVVPPEDETIVAPPAEETVVADAWEPESEVFVEQTETVPPRRPLPQIWPGLLAILLLVLGGLAAAYFLTRDDDEPAPTTTAAEVAEVPVVIGMRILPAMERIFDAGFEADRVQKASAKPSGVVFDQEPQPGTELELGRTVRLLVSTGPPKETVPDVVGEPVGEAVSDLRAAGLQAKQVEAFGPGEQGTVLKQEPAGGEKLREGATVTLTVSKGPRPVAVPDVVGTTSSEAAATLRDAGLDVNLVSVPSDEPPGTVIAQNPTAGTQAPSGSAVRLNVAQERDPGSTTGTGTTPAPGTTTRQAQAARVPDVVGQELADAARALAGQGLKAAVQYVPSNEAAGRVVAQAQPAGTQRRRGDTVQLNVSIGAEPAAEASVPDVVGQQNAEARQALEDAGFEVLALNLVTNRVRRDDRVASQTPASGASVPRGLLVLLYLT